MTGAAKPSGALPRSSSRRAPGSIFANFRDGYFPWQGDQIKDTFERLKSQLEPDVIFTHYRDDRHQDHRLVSDLTWNSFRDHVILEYEVPKYDGDFGAPNVFVALPAAQAERKVRPPARAFSEPAGAALVRRGDIPRDCCGCAGWNAMRPSGSPRPSTAASS